MRIFKVLFLYLYLNSALFAADIFDAARLQKAIFENKGVEPICFNVVSNYVIFGADKLNNIEALEGHQFKGFNSKILNICNFGKKKNIKIPVTKLINLDPGQRIEYEVKFPSYVCDILPHDSLKTLTWSTGDSLFVTLNSNDSITPKNKNYVTHWDSLNEQLELYRKFFMNKRSCSDVETIADFTSQGLGVTSYKRSEEVVVSLTSYPARFATTWLAIESLLRQQEKPDRINLNLFEDEFPGRVLPWFIRQQINRGLEVNFCPINYKVYLKVIPTVQKYPNAAVVATDDDIIYPPCRLNKLMDGYRKHPSHVIAQEVRETAELDGHIYPVCEWNFTGWNGYVDTRELGPSNKLIPEGVTGILFPPNSFAPIVFDYEKFKELSPTEDDLWLYVGCLLNGKSVFKIKSTYLPHVIDSAHNMDCALSKTNTADGYKVSSQCFYNLFYKLNLADALNAKTFSRTSDEARKNNMNSLSYNDFILPRNHKSPVALLKGFSWTENWIGNRGGVWTDGDQALFSVVNPSLGFVKVIIKSRFVYNQNHNSLSFRIKRNGYTLYRGEATSEYFDISFVDMFREHQQSYAVLIDNPVSPSTWGSQDPRMLGLLFHKVNVGKLDFNESDSECSQLSPSMRNSSEIINIDSSYIDSSVVLVREGANKIAFDYADYQLGIGEKDLKIRFSKLLENSLIKANDSSILENNLIPFLHHRAWHTSSTNPKEVPDHILEKYITSLKNMTDQRWTHTFWCNNKKLIPSTISKLLKACPWLNIREISEFPRTFIGKKDYEKLINDSRFTNANDIFRISLIHALGGVYFDLGFEVNLDISPLLSKYNAMVYLYETGAIDHNFIAMPASNKFTESYLRRLLNPSSVSISLRNKWVSDPYFQQHIFCGASGFLIDILERFDGQDNVLFVPVKNPFFVRYNLDSWHSGNSFGNKPVQKSQVDFFKEF